VGVLLAAYVLSFLDRQIVSLLVEPMKHDLALSDTQISLLQGLAFSICNGIGGLPLGRLVDTRRRFSIVSAGIAFWSIMTALCGVANRFCSLFLCRMGVGVGEASLTPAAYSLICDAVAPKRIGLALGIFTIGVHVGSGLALILGATLIAALLHSPPPDLPLIGTLRPWQAVFWLVGAPGLIVSLWALTVREPARQGLSSPLDPPPPLSAALGYLRSNTGALAAVYLCMAFSAMASYSTNAWAVSMLIRTYGGSAVQAGHSYGLVVIAAGALGVVSGGALGDAASARGWPGGRLRVMAAAAAAAIPFALIAPLAETPEAALTRLAPMIFFITMVVGLGPSALQELVPNQVRGMATSIGVLVVNLIGLGIGPTSIALVTDYWLQDEHQLRYALAALLPVMLLISATIGFSGVTQYGKTRASLAN
jgi:MFS family permease